jgi:hypothetical protein
MVFTGIDRGFVPVLWVASLGLVAGCGNTIKFAGDGETDAGPDVEHDATLDTRPDSTDDPLVDVVHDADDPAPDRPPDPGEDPVRDPDGEEGAVVDVLDEDAGGATGTTCDDAIDVTAGGTWHLSYAGYSDLWSGGSGCGFAAGPEIWFKATVPDGNLLTFRETSSTEVTLQLLTACPSTTCVDYASSPEVIYYENDTGSDVTVYIAVDSWWSSSTGPVDVTVTNVTVPDGLTCDHAVDATSLSSWSGTFSDYANLWSGGSGCGYGSGPEIWFTATVASGHLFTLEETTSTDVTLQLLTSCPSTTCDAYVTGPEIMPYYNDTGSSATIYIAAESWWSTSSGPVDVTISNAPAPSGLVCSNAVDVTSLSSWSGTFSDFANFWDGGTGCSWATGPEVWFRADVADGNTLTVTETSGTDVVLHRLDSCTTTTCLDSSDSPETLALTNTSGSTAVVYVVVERRSGTGGAIALTITNAP